ncbi:unnamed protein product [Paramecium sonneborni]|uniref:Uncharacterized protein n=1 Tax=Paramecium sonneborni TaxID=65129 RepID=A0A8S1L216_9CILI|nr:unnamed protein product [Paramecium sonneborni]
MEHELCQKIQQNWSEQKDSEEQELMRCYKRLISSVKVYESVNKDDENQVQKLISQRRLKRKAITIKNLYKIRPELNNLGQLNIILQYSYFQINQYSYRLHQITEDQIQFLDYLITDYLIKYSQKFKHTQIQKDIIEHQKLWFLLNNTESN